MAKLPLPEKHPVFAFSSAHNGKQKSRSFQAAWSRFGQDRLLFDMRIAGVMKLQLKGNWNEVKGKLKQKYGQLTDEDLVFVEGKQDELLGRLQKKLGKTQDELRSELEDL
jgi:uncharacterized protein YjbJ (UPF0337 family)